MNFQRYWVPIVAVGLVAWAWQSWGWLGVALVAAAIIIMVVKG